VKAADGEEAAMRVSVVIPAHNEAGNIGRLIDETVAALPPALLGEIVVVDDASADATGMEISRRLDAIPSLRCIRHDVRAGQSAALRNGVIAARMPIIATMDGDGQNDPADIPSLAARLGLPGSAGPALVGGVRLSRQTEKSKRVASALANRIRRLVLTDGCPDTGCGVKLFRRDAFLRLPYFSTMHRYLPSLFQTYGYEVAYAPVNDRPRQAGHSKYGNLGRALVGAYDLVGVRWLRARSMLPVATEIFASSSASSAEAAE
jgi:dolichol-phosphate mannosyltransferase